MRRDDCTKLCREEMDKNDLKHWKIHIVSDPQGRFVGKCVHVEKTILLNQHHVDLHPDAEILCTIRHELAHALTPGHGHDEVWAAKAREIGCDNVSTVCSLSLPPEVINAMRSGDIVEAEVTENVVRSVNYKVTKLLDRCEKCGKVAKELNTIEMGGKKMIFLECGHMIVKDLPKVTPFETIVFDGDPTCKHKWPKKIHNGEELRGTVCSECNAKRPYLFQVEGMRFIERYEGRAGIFDEMGLGKTIQFLGYVKFHPEVLPFLYICKSGLKFQAAKEMRRVLGDTYIPYIFNTSRDHIFPGFNCYIISFDLLRRMKQEKLDELKSFIKCIAIDEVQHIKNPDSSRTQEVRKLCREVKHIIPLSGGPWKNRGSEFYVSLNLIAPKKFHNYEGFKREWVQYYYEGDKTKEGGIRNPKKFKEFCSDVFIRRERAEVMKELPLINRTKLHCIMPKEAMEAYDEAVDGFVKIWNQLVIGGEENTFGAGSVVMQALNTMRQIVGIAKIPATLEFAEEFLQNTEDTKDKLLIFVHHIEVGNELYDQMVAHCAPLGVKVIRLEGGSDPVKRFQLQEQFNNDPDTRVGILSTLSAGEGLNLQTCSQGVMHERQWNPQNEEQPEGRMIRIGQKASNVNMMYVHAEGTCDMDLDAIVERKRIQFHKVMNAGEMQQWNQNSIIKELGEAIANKWKMRSRK